ncbi:MAG: hypothetical protein IH627_10830 [Rubrivivax sp.]|nr:hypothetical protein [Rubrivivax sp.]
MRLSLHLIAVATSASITLAGCGKKEEAPAAAAKESTQASNLEIDCSFAPSQSKVFAGLAAAGGGASVATAAIAQTLGLAALPHSSGALILSGAGGYIAGTLGTAFVLPTVISVGAGAGSLAVAVELICFPRNHPESAARLNAVASEFVARTRSLPTRAATATAPVFTKVMVGAVKTGSDALDFANRKSIEITEAIRAAAS